MIIGFISINMMSMKILFVLFIVAFTIFVNIRRFEFNCQSVVDVDKLSFDWAKED